MRFGSRMAVLVAAVCLPIGAVLASYALTSDPPAPRVPDTVKVGETNPRSTTPSPTTTPGTTPAPATTTPPPAPSPETQVVPPAPPVTGGDDDDDDDGGDDD